MKASLATIAVLLVTHLCSAQYWFGPKFGISYIDPVYQDPSIERDFYDISSDYDVQAGVALNYTATDLYSVYTEIVYERMNRDLVRKPTSEEPYVISNSVNNFITIPIMLRISLGKLPFHYYINGGPKISYWLSNKGSFYLESFEEKVVLDPISGEALEPGPQEYKLVFNPSKANGEDRLLLREPNRLQFGLTAGTGAFFDLASGARLMVDLRATFGHSNLGFDNGSETLDFSDDSHIESFEYTMNMLTVSIGYLFEYNTEFKRKGRSTSRESNKKKK